MKVFITGVSSQVGRAISMRLVEQSHEVVGFDLKRSTDLAAGVHFVPGDVRDFAGVARASAGCHTGLHLAAVAGGSPAEDILSVNVLGAYSFMVAAKVNGFRNAVVASSAPVHLPPDERDSLPLLRTSEDEDNLYDLSKAIQEVISYDFCTHGTPAMCLRFGHIVLGELGMTLDGSTLLGEFDYCRGGWVALEDVVAICARALETSPRGDTLEVLNVVGAISARARFNVRATEERLGFRFMYDFSDYELQCRGLHQTSANREGGAV